MSVSTCFYYILRNHFNTIEEFCVGKVLHLRKSDNSPYPHRYSIEKFSDAELYAEIDNQFL